MGMAQVVPEKIRQLRSARKRTADRSMLFSRLYRIQLGMHVGGQEQDAGIIQQALDEIKLLRIATGYYGGPLSGPDFAGLDPKPEEMEK